MCSEYAQNILNIHFFIYREYSQNILEYAK